MTAEEPYFLIWAVEYEPHDNLKSQAVARVVVSDQDGNGARVMTRNEVLREISLADVKFFTVALGPSGLYRKGQPVRPLDLNHKLFLTTDPNDWEEDNLGSLPSFANCPKAIPGSDIGPAPRT